MARGPLGATGARRAWWALVAIAALGSTACGIGDRQRHADVLHASVAKLDGATPATGTMKLSVEADERPLAAMAGAGPGPSGVAGADAAPPAPEAKDVEVALALDLDGRRAAVTFGPPEAAQGAVFADTRVFVRRQNARPTERRTWATLDLRRIVENERPVDTAELAPTASATAVASTVNPVYLLELAKGALAGSVRRVGAEALGAVPTTRYDANVSFDKAMTELDFDDDERAVRTRLFRLIGATKDVVPARFWIDDEGRLRRLRLELQQRVSRQRADDLTVTIELVQLGAAEAAPTLELPTAEATVTYERIGRLVRSALPEER